MAHYIKEQSLYIVHKKIMHINFSSADEKVFKLPTNKRNAKKKNPKSWPKNLFVGQWRKDTFITCWQKCEDETAPLQENLATSLEIATVSSFDSTIPLWGIHSIDIFEHGQNNRCISLIIWHLFQWINLEFSRVWKQAKV